MSFANASISNPDKMLSGKTYIELSEFDSAILYVLLDIND